MKERPILFSGPMVRALLAGTKTQTRRIVNPQPRYGHGLQEMWGTSPDGFEFGDKYLWREVGADYPDGERDDRRCPFGDPGDRLWVKEGLSRGEWEGMPDGSVLYAADDEPAWDVTQPCVWGWKRSSLPSMFCPRGLSRITLEVTEVRIEGLDAITEGDARAEGVPPMLGWPRPIDPSYRLGFRQLWDGINGKRAPWASNPWVWVVSFKRVEA